MLLYNSLTQKKEKLGTIEDKKVRMYVCGITPYDTTHLGHAFLYMHFDVLYRLLTRRGFNVTYVQNVTDIDDDILKKAKEEGRDWRQLGEYWTERFLKDYKALNMILPTHYVKATHAIDTIVTMVKGLIAKGVAYEKEGSVYFDYKKFPSYGALSKLSEGEMLPISAERGNNPKDPLKKHPLDFVLWQKSKEDEPAWKSPWSMGRPGWHIECSAMCFKHLGEKIDIHGGGHDLIYPHHESERAQSEAFTGKAPFVKYWMHAAMLLYKGEKMSKSLGNMVFVEDLLKKYTADAIRYVLLSHHYRQGWEFEFAELEKAEELLETMKQRVKGQGKVDIDKVFAYLDDDLDTLAALSYLSKGSGDGLAQGMRLLGFSSF